MAEMGDHGEQHDQIGQTALERITTRFAGLARTEGLDQHLSHQPRQHVFEHLVAALLVPDRLGEREKCAQLFAWATTNNGERQFDQRQTRAGRRARPRRLAKLMGLFRRLGAVLITHARQLGRTDGWFGAQQGCYRQQRRLVRMMGGGRQRRRNGREQRRGIEQMGILQRADTGADSLRRHAD